MDLLSGLYCGRESLITHGNALAVVSDNVANANTVGFKTDRTEFSDVLAESLGCVYSPQFSSGNGVAANDVVTLFSQGPIEQTDEQYDFAIEGDGFFVVRNGNEEYYTRAGNFLLDADGNLVTRTGESVMGYLGSDTTTLTPIKIQSGMVAAAPSALVTLKGNLDATNEISTVPAGAATYGQISSAANFHTVTTVFDSQGIKRDVDLYFFKTGVNTWTATAYGDGGDLGGTPGTPQQLGSTTMSFQPDGTQGTGATTALSITPAWSGSGGSTVSIDLSGMAQFGSASALTSVTADGSSAGNIVGFEVDKSGLITGRLDSGSAITLGTVALAKFVNNQSLQKIGDNKFQATEYSSAANIGVGNTQGRGTIKNGALENSSVDTASEFIDVIRYQRGYQAGSQVVKTMNELISTTLEIA